MMREFVTPRAARATGAAPKRYPVAPARLAISPEVPFVGLHRIAVGSLTSPFLAEQALSAT